MSSSRYVLNEGDMKPVDRDADLSVEVFHLQGEHDQQSHAGGRAKRASSIPEPSAEELEWRRSTREVPFLPNAAAGFESKRAVFRNDRWLLVHAEDGTAIRIEGGIKTGTQDRLDMVNALADAYDANPVTALDKWGDKVAPRIEILEEWDQRPGVVAYVMPGLDPAKYDIHSGVASALGPRGREPYRIFVNDSPDIWAEDSMAQFRRDAMPEVANHSSRKYIITHEYGHVRMALGDDNRDEVERIGGAVRGRGWMGMSEYGKSNQAESHAEAFTEWTLSGGQTPNQAARLYARDLRWPGAPAFSERIEDPIAASAGVDDYLRQPILCGDGPDGPVYVFADEAAPVEQFHLQGQHDQQSHAGGRAAEEWEDTRKYSQGTERETQAAKVFSGQFELDDYTYNVETVTTRDEYGDVKLEGRISDPTREPRWEGDALGDEVGKFMRTIKPDGRVINDVFIVEDLYQGAGIGNAFLDYTEERLQREFGTTEIEMKAVETGRYAWASRGYGTYDTGAVETWVEKARSAVTNGALGSDNANYRRFEAVMQDWEARVDAIEAVYPADLLRITPRFKQIFLDNDSPDWNGVRFLEPLTASAGQFHLQGEHDQQSHGRRGGASNVRTLDDTDGIIDGMGASLQDWLVVQSEPGQVGPTSAAKWRADRGMKLTERDQYTMDLMNGEPDALAEYRQSTEEKLSGYAPADDDTVAAVRAAAEYEADNPVFSKMIERYGDIPVIPVRDADGADARYIANAIVIGETTSHSGSAPITFDEFMIDRSMPGTLRHEYGHHVQGRLTVAQSEKWTAAINSWGSMSAGPEDLFKMFNEDAGGAGLSLYARMNGDETFAEAFALVTHRDFDPGRDYGPAQQIVDVMKEIVE